MRKLFALIAVLGMLTIGASSMLMAQENETTQTETTETYQEEEETTDPTVLEDESQIESTSFHAALKQKFIEGGAAFMSFVICPHVNENVLPFKLLQCPLLSIQIFKNKIRTFITDFQGHRVHGISMCK